METSLTLLILLPVVLAVIMFGMGLSLVKEDFTRLARMPLPVLLGLIGQILLLPAMAYAIAVVLDLSPNLAIGLMIMSACPGGTVSNIISQLARANLALSVTLTAIATVICVFTTPLIIAWSIDRFSQTSSESFSLLSTTIGLIVITLVPLTFGILTRAFASNWAIKYEEPFRKFSAIFMLVTIILAVSENWGLLLESFSQVAAATISLNVLGILLGLAMGFAFRLAKRDSVTLSIEIGIQNVTVAITIAITFLGQEAYAITAGVYGVTMYLGTLIPIVMMRLGNAKTN